MACVNRNVLPPVINIRDDYVIITPIGNSERLFRKFRREMGSCLRAFLLASLKFKRAGGGSCGKLTLIKI